MKEIHLTDEAEDDFELDPELVNDDDSDYVYSLESSSYDTSDNDDTVVDDSRLKSKIDLAEFEKTYSKMNDSDKWILSTEKMVEDALYNFGIKCKHEQ